MAKNAKDLQSSMRKATQKYGELSGKHVKIGLPSGRTHQPSGLPLAELGAIHEFGQGAIPERSFLRGALKANKKQISKNLTLTTVKVAKGASPKQSLEALALWGQGMAQEFISEGESNFSPLKSPRKNGGSNPLNDTGALRQGIIGIVDDQD